MTIKQNRPEDEQAADTAPENAQNPDNAQPEGGAHSPSQAAGEAGDGDHGHG